MNGRGHFGAALGMHGETDVRRHIREEAGRKRRGRHVAAEHAVGGAERGIGQFAVERQRQRTEGAARRVLKVGEGVVEVGLVDFCAQIIQELEHAFEIFNIFFLYYPLTIKRVIVVQTATSRIRINFHGRLCRRAASAIRRLLVRRPIRCTTGRRAGDQRGRRTPIGGHHHLDATAVLRANAVDRGGLALFQCLARTYLAQRRNRFVGMARRGRSGQMMGDDLRVLGIHNGLGRLVAGVVRGWRGVRLNIGTTGQRRMVRCRSDESANRVDHQPLVLLGGRTMLAVVVVVGALVMIGGNGGVGRRARFSIFARPFQRRLKSSSGDDLNWQK